MEAAMGTLRLALAISVALWHLNATDYLLISGYLAVIAFFMISGFYMSLTINAHYPKRPDRNRFYANRALRLVPPYLAALAFATAVDWHYGRPNVFLATFAGGAAERLSLIVSNLTFIGQDWLTCAWYGGWLKLAPGSRVIGPAWSIATEIAFYALAPFIVTRGRWIALLALAAGLAARACLLGVPYDPWRYYLTPAVLCFFLLGHLMQIARPPHWVTVGAAVGLAACLAAFDLVREADIDGWRYWMVYLLFAAILPVLFEATRTNRFDQVLGDLSYPVYLVHVPVIVIAGQQGLLRIANHPSAWRYAGLLTMLLAVAAVLHWLAVRPIEALRNALRRPSRGAMITTEATLPAG
jgi:peptidoglycan/LPS O-acetylase OafA/YrhL